MEPRLALQERPRKAQLDSARPAGWRAQRREVAGPSKRFHGWPCSGSRLSGEPARSPRIRPRRQERPQICRRLPVPAECRSSLIPSHRCAAPLGGLIERARHADSRPRGSIPRWEGVPGDLLSGRGGLTAGPGNGTERWDAADRSATHSDRAVAVNLQVGLELGTCPTSSLCRIVPSCASRNRDDQFRGHGAPAPIG